MELEFDAGDDVQGKIGEAAMKGLALAAEYVLAEANQRVPIEEGTLQRSGRTSVDPDTHRAAISYDTPYAVEQHENLQYRHDKGRSAKYLENALIASKDEVRQIIADQIKEGT